MPPRLLERYGRRSVARLLIAGRSGAALTAVRAGLAPEREVRRFVIFAQGRTGSTLLTSSLNSHPQIDCADEILDRPRGDPLTYVRNRARICRGAAFGFHVKCYQLSRIHGLDDWRGFLRELKDEGWQIVYLWRENVVRHVVSGFFAQASGRYHFRGSERRPERFRIEPDRFRAWLRQRTELLAQERAALEAFDYIELRYERDLQDPEDRARALATLQQALGVAPQPLHSPLKRSVDRPLSTLIENYAELARALEGTSYAGQLD